MIDTGNYKLVRLTSQHYEPLVAMLQDYTSEPDSRYQRDLTQVKVDFAGYIRHQEDSALGINLPPGFVPSTIYYLQNEWGELLGHIRIRSLMTPRLAHEAGNIGYDIRPSRRGRGLGTIQLALVLPICRELNLDHVLITCRRENLASARVIEKNGGVLESEVLSWVYPNSWFKRYWITIFDLPAENH